MIRLWKVLSIVKNCRMPSRRGQIMKTRQKFDVGWKVLSILVVLSLVFGNAVPLLAQESEPTENPVITINPDGWQDPAELFPMARAASTEVDPALLFAPTSNAELPNAAEQPGTFGVQTASVEETQARECFWANRLDEQGAPNGWQAIQDGSAPSGSRHYKKTYQNTVSITQDWNVDPDATEMYLRVSFRGSGSISGAAAVQFFISAPHRIGLASINVLDLSTQWQTRDVKLSQVYLNPGSLYMDTSSIDSQVRLEVDQVGLIYCKEPVNPDDVIIDVHTITDQTDPGVVMIPVIAGTIFYRVDSAWPLYSEHGFASIRYLMEAGCGGECFSSRFLPGWNPHAKELSNLYGNTGPWMSPYIDWVKEYGKDFVSRRGFDPVAAQRAIAEWDQKLANPSLGPVKREGYTALRSWTQSKLDLWNLKVAGNAIMEKAVNSKVVYGLEMKASEMSAPFRGGTEIYAKSGQVDPSRIRVLIFDADETDDFIRETYRQALRRGAPLSSLRVLKGEVDVTLRVWTRYAASQFGEVRRILPPIVQYGSGVMSGLATAARAIPGIAAATGEVVVVPAAAATFIVGVGDGAWKVYKYSQLSDYETSMSWWQYTCSQHGFSRMTVEYTSLGQWCVDRSWVESSLRTDGQWQPLVVQIPEHGFTTRRYSDGKRIFYTHPEVKSYWEMRIQEVRSDGVVLEKKLSNGTVSIDVPFDNNGHGLYTLLYDDPEGGLMTMTFEIVLIEPHPEGNGYRFGVSYLETQTPEDYGACPGWSYSRPAGAECFFGTLPNLDYSLYPDLDRDRVPTGQEQADPNGDGNPGDARDTDGDGIKDYMDDDDDGDGVGTSLEVDINGDGRYDWVDTDHDGVEDYLDRDSRPAHIKSVYLPAVAR